MFLWSANEYQEVDLVLPDGGRIHYVRTSPGNGVFDAVFEHTSSPGRFYESVITFVSSDVSWHLRLRDGTTYIIPAVNSAQGDSRSPWEHDHDRARHGRVGL